MARVLLINMPWSAAGIPSLGLGLLSSILRERGTHVSTYYANLHFSQVLFDHFTPRSETTSFDDDNRGTRLARFLTQDYFPRTLVDEYMFAHHYYGKGAAEDADYWKLFSEREENRKTLPLWKEALNLVPGFIDSCVEEVKKRDCDIIGFTSMFGQNMASLMLARRIKEELPKSVVVFGGANCEGEMGEALIANFPQLDYVVTGEAEISFPAVVSCVETGTAPVDVAGVVLRDLDGAIRHNGFSPPLRELDNLPVPDYGGYFRELQATSYADDVEPMVFLEQTRGCWWGQKHHCTFCGLNADGMVYRKKSDERCLEDLKAIAKQVPTRRIHYADNILDMKKFDGFLQNLKREDLDVSLFFEIKSNLRKNQLKVLKDAGTYSVQPGIENFSTNVLKEMRKGVSGLQNVQCLKWCKQYGIEALWNLLVGFPGETKDDYRINLNVLKSITHLDRQTSIERIITQRFSPNFDQAADLGFANVRPQVAYHHVYELPAEALSKICYSFDYDYVSDPDVTEELRALTEFNRRWADCEAPGTIVYMQLEDGGAMIVDTRFNTEQNVLRITAQENAILQFLDRIRTSGSIARRAAELGWECDQDVMDFVLALQAQRFVVSEGDRYLGVIPLPMDDPDEETSFDRVLIAVS